MRNSLKLAGALALAAGAAGAAQAQGIPNGHLPPPGECRVWQPGVPPGQQPPPMNCRQAERQADRYGGRVIYGGQGGPYDEYDNWNDRRFSRWALRNFDLNHDGRLSRREYRLALDAWNRR